MSKIKLENVSVSFQLYKSNNKTHSILLELFKRKKKSSFLALNDVSFSAEKGDRIALIGMNGAGKTTLLKVLGGILPQSTGEIEINGNVLPLVNKTAGLIVTATCRQNIVLMGLSRGLKKHELEDYLDNVIESCNLKEFIDSPMTSLSAGMANRLVVSLTAHNTSDIVVMDEWIGASDRATLTAQGGVFDNLVKRSEVFILASHNQNLIRKVCNKCILLDKGHLRFYGDIEQGIRELDILTNKISVDNF